MRLLIRVITIAFKALYLLFRVVLIRWFGEEQTNCILAGLHITRKRVLPE